MSDADGSEQRIIVVGAGIIGICCALALRENGSRSPFSTRMDRAKRPPLAPPAISAATRISRSLG